jgi:phosphoribosyl-AMP cyclohydrolase
MNNDKINDFLSKVAFNNDGLVPVIVQRQSNNEVLMMAWFNKETLAMTLATGDMIYWSRSRKEIWKKGATSGNVQKLKEMLLDCDGDCLLAKIEQTGSACHTGAVNCFFQEY